MKPIASKASPTRLVSSRAYRRFRLLLLASALLNLLLIFHQLGLVREQSRAGQLVATVGQLGEQSQLLCSLYEAQVASLSVAYDHYSHALQAQGEESQQHFQAYQQEMTHFNARSAKMLHVAARLKQASSQLEQNAKGDFR